MREWFGPEDVVKPDDHWLHPMRYPKHDDELKGQVFGGVCNTTACDNMNATYWNQGTYALYCAFCGRHHNWQPTKPPLSVEVDAKPCQTRADIMHDKMMKDMSKAGGF